MAVFFKLFSSFIKLNLSSYKKKSMAGELMGHRGETTILILLNGHSIKLASTFLSPYPFISAAFRLKRNFLVDGILLQKLTSGLSTETKYLWSAPP